MKNIFIPSSQSDLNLAVAIHEPVRDPKGIAILCPGYLDSKDYQHLIILAEDLSQIGYVAIRFDPLGTWESDGDTSFYSNDQILEDYKKIETYALETYGNQDLYIGGHSRGGRMSLVYASNNDKVKGVFAIMPSSGGKKSARLDEWKESGFRKSSRDLPQDPKKSKIFQTPYEIEAKSHLHEVLPIIKNISARKLFIYAEDDVLVSIESVKKLYDNAPQPKEIIGFTGMGHDYRKNKNQIRLVNDEIMSWIKKQ